MEANERDISEKLGMLFVGWFLGLIMLRMSSYQQNGNERPSCGFIKNMYSPTSDRKIGSPRLVRKQQPDLLNIRKRKLNSERDNKHNTFIAQISDQLVSDLSILLPVKQNSNQASKKLKEVRSLENRKGSMQSQVNVEDIRRTTQNQHPPHSPKCQQCQCKHEIASLKKDLASKQQKLSKNSASLQILTSKYNQLNSKYKILEQQITAQKEQLDTKQQITAQYESIIAQLNTKIQHLIVQSKTQQHKVKQFRSKYQHKQTQLQQKQLQVSEYQKHHGILLQMLKKYKSQLQSQKATSKVLNKQNEKQAARIEYLNRKVEDYKKKYKSKKCITEPNETRATITLDYSFDLDLEEFVE